MTELLYLKNQDLFQGSAKVLEIIQFENQFGIVLDQTIFYVQGGGQPGDRGLITNQGGIFEVNKTVFDAEGKALHLGRFIEGGFGIDSEVNLKIDLPSRQLNSKIHSAGHLIDLAVKNCGLNWLPGKGFHYPEGSYVEYSTRAVNLDLEELKKEIQSEYNKLTASDLKVEISFETNSLFKGQPLRKMSFAGFGELPCGGTHVKSTLELKDFKITKIKQKGEIIKVSYSL